MISTDFAPNEDRSDAAAALSLSVKSADFFKGEYGETVKEKLHQYFPDHHITLLFTARAALYSYLKSLNLPPKSEVLVTGFTCEAVVIPVKALELTPVFIDIDKETFSMNPAEVKKNITKNTRLIILQHTFGIPPHRKEIIALAEKQKIPVLEDLAHGFDEQLFKKDTRDTDKLLSFGRSKVMSSVFGGALLTRDNNLHGQLEESLKELPYPSSGFMLKTLFYKPLHVYFKDTYDIGIGKISHFICNKLGVFPKELSKTERMLGMDPYVLKQYPNAMAYMLLNQLKKFDRMQDTRRKITEYYSQAHGLALQGLPLGRFPLLVQNRDELRKKLAKKNIFLGRWYHYVLAKPGECPVAEDVSKHIINLPTLVSLKDAERVENEIDSSIICK